MKEYFGSVVMVFVFAFFLFCFFNNLFYIAPFEELSKNKNVGLPLLAEDLNRIKESGILLFDAKEIICYKDRGIIEKSGVSCDLYFSEVVEDSNIMMVFALRKPERKGSGSLKDCNVELLLETGEDASCGISILLHGQVSGFDSNSRMVATGKECIRGYKIKSDLNTGFLCEPYFETVKSIRYMEGKNFENSVFEKIPTSVKSAKLTEITFKREKPDSISLAYTEFNIYELTAHKNFLNVSGLNNISFEGIRKKVAEDWNCDIGEKPKCCLSGICIKHDSIISFFVSDPLGQSISWDYRYEANKERKLAFLKAFAVKLGKQ
ncbi:MAG: hypothetical protein N3F05_02425 [Candidatus Diapherotrites archaeon]|nr:hypothetical protein [Candidatus Diapherotrites archaeon]